MCTLINAPGADVCAACSAPWRPQVLPPGCLLLACNFTRQNGHGQGQVMETTMLSKCSSNSLCVVAMT